MAPLSSQHDRDDEVVPGLVVGNCATDSSAASEKNSNGIDTHSIASTSEAATTMDPSRNEEGNQKKRLLPETRVTAGTVMSNNRRNSLIKIGKAHSEPDIFSRDDDDDDSDYETSDDEEEEEEDEQTDDRGGKSLLARVGSSMRNVFAASDNINTTAPAPGPQPPLPRPSSRPTLQRGYQSERIIRQGPNNNKNNKNNNSKNKKLAPLSPIRNKNRGFFDFKDDNHNNNNDGGGVVMYLGREYSARDLLHRCNSSAGSIHSRRSNGNNNNNESFASLLSFEEEDSDDSDDSDDDDDSTQTDDEEEEEEEVDEGIIGQFLGRGFASLSKLGGGGGNDDNANYQQFSRSLSDDGIANKYNHQYHRTSTGGGSRYRPLSPPRQASFNWRPRSRSPPPPSSSSSRGGSSSSTPRRSPRDHLGTLSVDPDDVLKITENPKEFAALKKTLKKNKAVTNGLLQQGFHVFLHQQKEQQKRLERHQQRKRQQQQKQQQLQQRERSNPTSSSGSNSPVRIPRPTRTGGNREMRSNPHCAALSA